ncbi:hypothetical protein GGI07_001420 [Coemansia sp. Benny D115]|nr:hypothetical protein GGI07_001420 [Coemansia sp. Benny D115]
MKNVSTGITGSYSGCSKSVDAVVIINSSNRATRHNDSSKNKRIILSECICDNISGSRSRIRELQTTEQQKIEDVQRQKRKKKRDRQHREQNETGEEIYQQQPLHRKLQQSAYINKRRMEVQLADRIRRKFGIDPTLVLGDWSATNVRWHASIPGIGLRRMLIRQGFRDLLIGGLRTSTMCPYCHTSRLEKFLLVENPRLHGRDVRPTITSHALLRCNSATCIGRVADSNTDIPPRARCLNRDLAALLNFQHIINGLQLDIAVLERFRRGNQASNNAAAPDERLAQRRRTE